jgi:hypothetical protein
MAFRPTWVVLPKGNEQCSGKSAPKPWLLVSWLWGVIKACLLGLFLALKNLVVLPRLSIGLGTVTLLYTSAPLFWGWTPKGPRKQVTKTQDN